METKQIKISELVPQGYEIDKKQSTFENIILKPIEVKLPLHVQYIPNRFFYINSIGTVIRNDNGYQTANSLSTENRAKAFLALMQLVELRDACNGDWKPDWENSDYKYCIYFYRNKLEKCLRGNVSATLHFKTPEIRDKFAEQFKDLINEAKELL